MALASPNLALILALPVLAMCPWEALEILIFILSSIKREEQKINALEILWRTIETMDI